MNIWDDNLLSEKFDIVMKEGQLNMKAFESESTMQHTNLFKSASNDHTTQESRRWFIKKNLWKLNIQFRLHLFRKILKSYFKMFELALKFKSTWPLISLQTYLVKWKHCWV